MVPLALAFAAGLVAGLVVAIVWVFWDVLFPGER